MMDLPKILIVEDDPLIAEDLYDLCQLEGYPVCPIAYNAGQALIHLQDYKPQIAILDINLSDDLDGIEIAKKIESDFRIPYLFLTSYSDATTLARVYGLNYRGYIVKPFNKNQLFASLDLAWKQSQPQKTKDINQWLLDQNIKLTGREMDVFLRLLRGESVSELSEKLNISPNTAKYYIKNIYTKLDVHSRATFFVKVKEIQANF